MTKGMPILAQGMNLNSGMEVSNPYLASNIQPQDAVIASTAHPVGCL